jgi:hypothetical protein
LQSLAILSLLLITLKEMAEVLLCDVDVCVECLRTKANCFLTRDHTIAQMMGKDHPLILAGLVRDRVNITPICRAAHRHVDRNKFRAYFDSGVSGLVTFLDNGYPKSPDPELLILQRRQLVYLFGNMISRINYLNGDTPRAFKDDYKRACDLAAASMERALELGIE